MPLVFEGGDTGRCHAASQLAHSDKGTAVAPSTMCLPGICRGHRVWSEKIWSNSARGGWTCQLLKKGHGGFLLAQLRTHSSARGKNFSLITCHLAQVKIRPRDIQGQVGGVCKINVLTQSFIKQDFNVTVIHWQGATLVKDRQRYRDILLVIKASLSKQIGVIKVSQLSGLLPLRTRALDSLHSGRGYLGHLRCRRQCVGIL